MSQVMNKWIIVVLYLLLPTTIPAQERGMFFEKKSYDHQPLPTYEQSKSQLPIPILSGHPEWIELYWKSWEIAFSHLKSPEPTSPLVSNWIDEALSPQIFQWDTHFIAMYGRYAHHIFPFIHSHDNFYAAQHQDGMICRVINENDGSDHEWGGGPDNARAINPPLFGWAEIETYKVTGDKSRFKMILSPLEHYTEWIERHRKCKDTPHQLFWSNGQASGMDNTPRDYGRKLPGDGWDYHSATDHAGWIDMSAQMVMCYQDLAYICTELGYTAKADKYKGKANDIAKRINEWLWDDKTGLYYDVNPEGEKTPWITAATFWPMFAGIATEEQCKRLVDNLLRTDLFWRRTPVPSLAANQSEYDPMGRYWKGGVWAPLNYMIVEGLKKNGYREVAVQMAEKHLNTIAEVYGKTKTIWEVYSPEMNCPATDAGGINMVKPNFVGWTGLVPISMLIETILGIEVYAPGNSISWHITQEVTHGIKQLRCNGATVDLVAEKTAHSFKLYLRSDQTVTVHIYYNNQCHTFNLRPDQPIEEVMR